MPLEPELERMLRDAGISLDDGQPTIVKVEGPATIETATTPPSAAPDEASGTSGEIASDATDSVGATQTPHEASLALVDGKEPSDYIEPDWARFMFHYWDKMDDTPAVIMAGPRGTGKTLAALVYGKRRDRKLLVANCGPDMTGESLIGTPRLNLREHGGDYWAPGPIMLAAKHDAILVLDEFNVLGPAAQVALNPLTDAVQNGIFNSYTGERVTWENPRIICTFNEGYAGTREIQPAFRDRAETMNADYLPESDEINLVVSRTGADQAIVENAVKTANAIRTAAKGMDGHVMPIEFDLSPRAVLSFARRVVAGMEVDRAFREAIIDRVGKSFRVAATRMTVVQIAAQTGGYNLV